MVDKVLINNIEKYELSFFKIAMQLRAINYLEEKNALNEKICNQTYPSADSHSVCNYFSFLWNDAYCRK